ncbi:hypothetical protein F1654_08350 [Alkalicaulis satelles]|uniref:Uncharacterized protein n=1 Tax=Alkalicaulis satelles TaxID=2609175 RepID=A0A5M6ZHM5_9PROT|nr:hypothetical protein [Alkalicaulis satelles]KAA5803800.1 hypothetical protein F1654_08350 [Alkalicaulis satelles]
MAYSASNGGYARNAGKRWRGEDLAQLRALARKGAPVRLISLRLGRPDSAIRAKAGELGLTLSNAEPVIAPAPSRTLSRTPRRDIAPAMAPARAPQGDLFAHA